MAIGVGALVASLGLDAAEYVRGLTKAEQQAKNFGNRLQRSTRDASAAMNFLTGAIKGAAAALSIGVFAGFIKSIIDANDQLFDLSKRTGVAIDDLAGLGFAFKQDGASAEELATGLKNLNKSISLAGTGDKEKQSLFKALGMEEAAKGAITAKEALLQLAGVFPRLNEADRVRVAMELLGKAGESLVPTLSAGAASLRSMMAEGLRLNPNIAEAARVSNEFNDAVDKIGVAFRGSFLPGITAVLPSLTRYIENLALGQRLGLSFAQSMGFKPDVSGLAALNKEIEKLEADQAGVTGFVNRITGFGKKSQEFIDLRKKERDAILKYDKEQRDSALATMKMNERAIEAGKGGRIVLPGPAAPKVGGGAKSNVMSEAERYLESLQRQLLKTKELTVVQTVLAEIESGRLTLSKGVTQEMLVSVARQIDAANALKKAEDERQRASEKFADIARKELEDRDAATKTAIEASKAAVAQATESNKQLEFEISMIGKSNLERELGISLMERQLALTLAVQDGDKEAINLLFDKRDALLKVGDALAEQFKKQQEMADTFRSSFADSFTDIIDGTKSVKEGFKSMVDDLVRQLNRIATNAIADKLFGKQGSGGEGIFGDLIKSWLSSGGAFALGGMPPIGRPSLVGERGPELFVPKVAGTIVPNERLGGSNVYNINVNVPQGTSRASSSQIARETAAAVARAQRRDG